MCLVMLVTYVEPSSPAYRLKIKRGDTVVSIDGLPLRDRLDAAFASGARGGVLRIRTAGGRSRKVKARVPLGEMGLSFEEMAPKRCKNKCVFCFIHQLPKGMRKSLYVKDEDYRYSFLFGNFLTLTNLTPDDLDRIERQRLSPLYVSVHATDEVLRRKLLGVKRSAAIVPLMKRLGEAGVEMHCQIVVCPDYNDGAVLERTVFDLWELGGAVRSVGIVPVGLTRHRVNLPKLRAVRRPDAEDIVQFVEESQEVFRADCGEGFVYAADEIYLRAGRPIPPASMYDGYPQKENGVGLARIWLDGCRRGPLGSGAFGGAREISVVTGRLAAPLVEEGLAYKLRRTAVGTAHVHAVRNRFFGAGVTVAGLLTGKDILSTLRREGYGEVVCLPPDAVNCDGVTLDDMSPEDFAAELDCEVRLGFSARARARARAGAA
jgi:putative radical SAM enzyme (TIGR03279 family)